LPRLADKGQQEIELRRRQVDPPARGTDEVARGLLERPAGEEVEPLDRPHRVGAADFGLALADGVLDHRRFAVGIVQNEYPHHAPPTLRMPPPPGESSDRDES
jgi:hypothetical protein